MQSNERIYAHALEVVCISNKRKKKQGKMRIKPNGFCATFVDSNRICGVRGDEMQAAPNASKVEITKICKPRGRFEVNERNDKCMCVYANANVFTDVPS
jgi:hypothetical protein